MDAVAAFPDDTVSKVLVPTMEVFMKILEKQRPSLESYPRQTFRFGPAERQLMDVYYPDPKDLPEGRVPVLFFVYGGAFVGGDRRVPPPFDLAYINLGQYFAKRGILTVIADYQLVPAVQYPVPPQDIYKALTWFLEHPTTIISASDGRLPPTAKLDRVSLVGHSAGANHLATAYLSSDVIPLDSPVRAATLALIPQGGAYRFDFSWPDNPEEILCAYYGSKEGMLANQPMSLLERAPDALIKGLPEVFVLASGREPPSVRQISDEFVEKLEARLGKKVRYEFMEGHNHISVQWVLLTGDEKAEKWAEDVAAYVKEKVKAS